MLFRYDTFIKQAIEYDTAPHYVIPLFRIGEVARMLNRSAETIRRYETMGLIPKAKKLNISKDGYKNSAVRLYKESDVYELSEFFAHRRPVGRPPAMVRDQISKINQKELTRYLDSRFQQVKRNG